MFGCIDEMVACLVSTDSGAGFGDDESELGGQIGDITEQTFPALSANFDTLFDDDIL